MIVQFGASQLLCVTQNNALHMAAAADTLRVSTISVYKDFVDTSKFPAPQVDGPAPPIALQTPM